MCTVVWKNREQFLEDANVEIIGYQVDFKDLASGLFLFNHSCRTTLALEVSKFKDLYEGPIFAEHATGGDECPEYCLRECELRPCPARCECAYVREIIQTVINWPKKRARTSDLRNA